MSTADDITRLAARRQAALRRNARRLVEDEEEREEAPTAAEAPPRGHTRHTNNSAHGRHSPDTSMDVADTRLVGRALDVGPVASSAAQAIRSAHDERRAINALIYGRLNQVDATDFQPKAFVSSRAAKAAAMAAAAAAPPSVGPQRPEDFMDAEDRSSTSTSAVPLGSGKGGSFAAAAAFQPGMGVALKPAAERNQVVISLLRASGWRAHVAKAREEREAREAQGAAGATRIFGAALPPGMVLGSDSQLASDSSLSDAQAYRLLVSESAALATAESAPTATRKTDTAGIGFVAYSALTTAEKSRVDRTHGAQYAALAFVRAKQPDQRLAQPKVYSIDVPREFDGTHRYVPPPSPPPAPIAAAVPAPSSTAATAASVASNLIQQWQGTMNAQRRGHIQRTSLPLPPRPTPSMLASAASTPAVALSASAATPPPASSSPSTGSTAPGLDQAALDAHAAHLRRLNEQQQRRHLGGGAASFSRPLPPPPPPHFAAAGAASYPPAATSMPPVGSTPFHASFHGVVAAAPNVSSSSFSPAGSATAAAIDMKALIEAAKERVRAAQAGRAAGSGIAPAPVTAPAAPMDSTAAADARRQERRARWGPVPTGAVPIVSHAPVGLGGPLPTGTRADAAAASLATTFLKFEVAGTLEPAVAVPDTDVGSRSHAPLVTDAAISSKALQGMMRNFVEAEAAPAASSASATGDAGSSAPSVSLGPSPVVRPPPVNDHEAAARMGMYGPLTRSVEAWEPHALVYKRFAVPQPSRLAGKESHKRKQPATNNTSSSTSASRTTGASVPGFANFVQSETMFGSTPMLAGLHQGTGGGSANQATSADSAMVDAAQAEQEEEAAMQAELMRDDDDDDEASDSRRPGVKAEDEPMHDAASAAPTGPSAASAHPSLALFKAIFENDDEENEPTPKSPKKPVPKLEPPHTHHHHQQQQQMRTEPPLFAVSSSTVPMETQVVRTHRPANNVPIAVAAPAAGSSSAIPKFAGGPSREVISIDLDDDDDEDMGVQITGFGGSAPRKPHQQSQQQQPPLRGAPTVASFRSNLQFVPPAAQAGKQLPPHGQHASRLAARYRTGIDGEDDDVYDTPMASAAPLPGLHPHDHDAPSSMAPRMVPPPVRPKATIVVPPPVPASWPFARFSEPAHGPAAPLATAHPPARSSAPALSHDPHAAIASPAATPLAAAAASTPTALLEHLLAMRKIQKHAKRESRKKERKESTGSSSSSRKKKKKSKSGKEKKHRKSRKRSASEESSASSSGSGNSSTDSSGGSDFGSDSDDSRSKKHKKRARKSEKSTKR